MESNSLLLVETLVVVDVSPLKFSKNLAARFLSFCNEGFLQVGKKEKCSFVEINLFQIHNLKLV